MLEDQGRFEERTAKAKKEDKESEAQELKKMSKVFNRLAKKMKDGTSHNCQLPALPRRRTNKAGSAVSKLGTSPLAAYIKSRIDPDRDDWKDLTHVPFGALAFVMALAAFFTPCNVKGMRLHVKVGGNTWQLALVSFKVRKFVTLCNASTLSKKSRSMPGVACSKCVAYLHFINPQHMRSMYVMQL